MAKDEQVYHLSSKEVLAKQKVDPERGLTADERARRLEKYGYNRLPEPRRTTLLEHFLAQFKNPIVLLLLGTTVISALTGKVIEPMLIAGIVVFMASVGVFLERQSESSLEKLKKLQSDTTSILVDGKIEHVPTETIVPGDILLLAEGDKVAADARVIQTVNVKLDESALTGESLPVVKKDMVLGADTTLAERRNMIFAGTSVVEGAVKAIVIDTAAHTQLGVIASYLQKQVVRRTPLEEELTRVGRFILIATLVSTVGMLIVLFLRGETILEALLTTTSLAIAFIPEGLSAVLTVTLALAVADMVKKKVIVKKLLAAEGLGSITHIATDKTGTITEGRMFVTKVFLNGKLYDVADPGLPKIEIFPRLIDIIRFCNNNKGPTEQALVAFLDRNGFSYELEGRRVEYQFTSSLKRMSVIYQHNGRLRLFSKGAPEVLIPLCATQGNDKPFPVEEQEKALAAAVDLASQGFRVLAVADKPHNGPVRQDDRIEAERGLNFIALIALMDPLRSTVKDTVKSLKAAGITPLMITGDHPEIARYIAEQSGIIQHPKKETVLTGSDLDHLFGHALLPGTKEKLMNARVFARVRPEHKVMIIDMYQQLGCRIAMTGDGVNDAAAIKRADVGIAMSNGMDITRDIADVVVTGEYDALIRAVSIGRTVKLRTQLYLHYLLSGNACQIGVFFFAIALVLPVPLTPIMLLMLNILTDALPAMAMAIEPEDPDITKRRAEFLPKRIISREVVTGILSQALVSTLALGTVFYLSLPQGLIVAQTSVFTVYIFQKALRSFTARSFTKSVFTYGFFSNRLMNIAFPLVIGVWFTMVYLLPGVFSMQPLDLNTVLGLLGIAVLMPITEEIVKAWNRRRVALRG